jgi:hypothetical protein
LSSLPASFSASITFATQYRGISLLISPANWMKRALSFSVVSFQEG